jgi:hypothetical protein
MSGRSDIVLVSGNDVEFTNSTKKLSRRMTINAFWSIKADRLHL